MDTTKSPLSVDKETMEKFGITPDDDASPIAKVNFLNEQLAQIQAMNWRSRVDVVHAKRLSESTNESLKHKGLERMATHLNEVEQSLGAMRMLKKMIAELREEYPELKPQA
jgi:hypothetical protein